MNEKTVHIPNITCGHCVKTIETELATLENVVSVRVDEQNKELNITWKDPQSWQNIVSLLEEINYPPKNERSEERGEKIGACSRLFSLFTQKPPRGAIFMSLCVLWLIKRSEYKIIWQHKN